MVEAPWRNRDSPRVSVTEGARLFEQKCSACHGRHGKGDVAVALNQQGFLARADNQFIVETIFHGRGNTAMPGWWQLSEEEIAKPADPDP